MCVVLERERDNVSIILDASRVEGQERIYERGSLVCKGVPDSRRQGDILWGLSHLV